LDSAESDSQTRVFFDGRDPARAGEAPGIPLWAWDSARAWSIQRAKKGSGWYNFTRKTNFLHLNADTKFSPSSCLFMPVFQTSEVSEASEV
jgi:hypothetical protein